MAPLSPHGPLVRLLQAAVELVGEVDTIAVDADLIRAIDLAQRSLAGLLPEGDLEAGVDAMVELSELTTPRG